MSSTISFDTHRFVKRLTGHGFTGAQAEALAHEQVHLLEANLATKDDLAVVKGELEVRITEVKTDLEAKIEQVRSDLEAKIEQLKSDLELKIEQFKSSILMWMLGALTAHLVVVAALFQYLR